jgi:hypothetical protein
VVGSDRIHQTTCIQHADGQISRALPEHWLVVSTR